MLGRWAPAPGKSPYQHFIVNRRAFVTTTFVVDRPPPLPVLAAMAFIYCPKHPATFPVAFVGPAATTRDELVEIVSHASCPD
jgi:hypothetical protein